MKKITILGSTGSIGTQTLDVIANNPEQYQVVGLAAGYNIDVLRQQIHKFRPHYVSVATKELAETLRTEVPDSIKVLYGEEGLIEIAAVAEAEFVVTAIVGSAGLRPTMAAIEAGKTIGLANKETLVTAGHIVMEQAARHQVQILPVDSEHSAIFQCLNGESAEAVHKIILTASGGSFRDLTRAELHDVTVEQALKHPNWSMGAKITIDCATMVNKGLEVIEAHWLFGLDYAQIDVVIHPQSVIHSMVQFKDQSVIAQLGTPDMRVPIQYALTYPQRCETHTKPLELTEWGALHFRPVDYGRFPGLKLAYDCGKMGGTATTVFNAANEIAVAAFLQGEIPFLEIEAILEKTLNQHHVIADPGLEAIEETDRWARQIARSMINLNGFSSR